MVVLLASISVLFLAACVAVLITHGRVQSWRAPGQSGLPWGSAASSALLVAVSWQLQRALVAIRSNRFIVCLQSWRWAALLAVAFLLSQVLNARHLLYLEGALATEKLFVFCYDLLVGLHAAHVIGGLVPLAVVHARIARREYSSSRHAGLTFCVQYWHYLAAAWIVVLGTLAWIG
jgi:heme/copper-type cytochrome/quinol oxidase subunit 3